MDISQQQLNDKEKILEFVAKYADKYHKNSPYQKGEKINYSGRVYDKNEMVALVDSALDFWLTSGRYTQIFENNLADYLGVNFCSVVNSGSSANLLAFMTLTSPLLEERAIKHGDEVITVAAGFPTTVAPIVQFGAVPVFVDITIPEYNLDVSMIEKAISHKTRAVMLAHTLGNPFNLKQITEICEKHNLWLIEDNCDSLGSMYEINGEWKYTGTIGDIGTSSFYPPHHITMGEGGAVYTNNPLLHKIVMSLRDWGRDCVCPSGVDNMCQHRFEGKYGDLPKGYDHKYVYSHFGYNLKATDMQAAIGVEQLKKLSYFNEKRVKNFNRLLCGLSELDKFFILPKGIEKSKPSWFGFMITCKQDGMRNKLVNFLERNGIQTRMLFAGNILKQPCFDEMRRKNEGFRIVGKLNNTDTVMKNSFWIGVYPGMTDEMIDYMVDIIKKGIE